MARDLLNIITRYHRIQGSRELNIAIQELREILNGMGLSTKLLKITPGGVKGYMEIPAGWNLKKAYLEFKVGSTIIEKFDSKDYPTLPNSS
jgi:hypothetical protein